MFLAACGKEIGVSRVGPKSSVQPNPHLQRDSSRKAKFLLILGGPSSLTRIRILHDSHLNTPQSLLDQTTHLRRKDHRPTQVCSRTLWVWTRRKEKADSVENQPALLFLNLKQKPFSIACCCCCCSIVKESLSSIWVGCPSRLIAQPVLWGYHRAR